MLFTRSDPEKTIRDTINNLIADIKPIPQEKINIKELTKIVLNTKEKKKEITEKIKNNLKKKELQDDTPVITIKEVHEKDKLKEL